MSLNTAHADHGVLIHAGECILIYSDNVTVEFYGNDEPVFKGTKNGRMYLTTHRMIYNSKTNADTLRSFSFPFIALEDMSVEQPMFGANYLKGKVRAQPNGNFLGEVKFKMTFKSGGAIEFGQAMLKVAQMATRGMSGNVPPPPYTPPSGSWYAAPPPAYAPPPQGYYGWVPPTDVFPDQPPSNGVFMSNAPPPYPGISAYGPPNIGYPPVPNGNMPPSFGAGYPPAPNSGYSGGPPAYPGTAPSAPGFVNSGPSGTTTQGMSSADAKAAEAAQSAYYDPNRPQTAFVPPPYDMPPSYQTASKKDN